MEPLCKFSRSGECFATCSSGGELKVWDSKTRALQQTISSSHLQETVSCLAWSRVRQSTRKRHSTLNSPLLIGGGVGSKVVVWNITKDDEEVLKGHDDEVSCIDWDKHKLYSGSKDQHVMEWDVDTGMSSRRWKADKMSVQCICCYGDESVLLTAGRAIKLWSLEDYTLIKKVSGHASTVNRLAFVGKDRFLSSAGNERVINYWQASSSSGSALLTTLTCEEEVKGFDCATDEEGVVLKVAVVSQEGNLFLYELTLSNPLSLPITHTYAIQYVSSPPKPSTPSPLPVLAATLNQHMITVAHSSYIVPTIETIEFEQPDRHVCLVRDINPGGLLLTSARQQVSSRPVAEKVTVLGPGNMTLPTQFTSLLSKQTSDLRPLRDRIEPEARKSKGPAPSADSLTLLLVQSVASGDGKLMEEVLRVSKEKLITSTIKKLPVHIVLPFLKKLIELLQSSPSRGLELSLWIKTIFSAHTAYLMTVPQLSASLSGLHQLLEARISTFTRLCHLQGKLDLMISQGELGGRAQPSSPPSSPVQIMSEGGAGREEESDSEEWSSGSEKEDDISMTTESSEDEISHDATE